MPNSSSKLRLHKRPPQCGKRPKDKVPQKTREYKGGPPDPGPPPWDQTEEEKSPDYQRLSNVHPMFRQIVNRDCHDGSTAKSVVQNVISTLRNGTEALRAMSPFERRRLIED